MRVREIVTTALLVTCKGMQAEGDLHRQRSIRVLEHLSVADLIKRKLKDCGHPTLGAFLQECRKVRVVPHV